MQVQGPRTGRDAPQGTGTTVDVQVASAPPARIHMQLFSEPSYRMRDRPPLIDPSGTPSLEDGRGFFRSIDLTANRAALGARAGAGGGASDAAISAKQVGLHAPGGVLAPMGWFANGPNNSGPEPFTARTATVRSIDDPALRAAWDELFAAAAEPRLAGIGSHAEAMGNVPGRASFWISTGDQMIGTTARDWVRSDWLLHGPDLAPEARRLVEAAVAVNDLAIRQHGTTDGPVAGRAARLGAKLLGALR